MTEQTTDETVETDDQVDDVEQTDQTTDELTELETFPREYVQQLRDENAKYRTRASDRDDVANRLHVALVAATGRLADPTDLAFDEAHLEDPATLEAAIDQLVASKPHLASRRPAGDVGQGVTRDAEPVTLAGILRSAAS